jgi:hypothetical protein
MQGVRIIAVCFALLATASFAGRAAAQDDQTPQGPLAPDEPVEARGVGIAGGVLLGAELILVTESLIGVDPVWPWVVFPIVGAAGGGVGGYFLEEASPGGAIALLVTGLVAIIPTVVAISVSRAYDPEKEGAVADDTGLGAGFSFERTPDLGPVEEETTTEVESRPEEAPEDGAPPGEDEGGEEEGGDGGPQARPAGAGAAPRVRHLAGGSLLHIDPGGGFGFGVPAPEVRTAALLRDSFLPGFERGGGLEVSFPVLRIDLP